MRIVNINLLKTNLCVQNLAAVKQMVQRLKSLVGRVSADSLPDDGDSRTLKIFYIISRCISLKRS